ncbi:MAG: DUF3794 domain-containing protein [Clostridia bacterium]|nr:DUF3794 domain-containing protein [Clostridia bacterium]
MEIRQLKEKINMERLAGRGRGQTTVEGEITLPGGLREEARVLEAGGMAVIDAAEALQDRVTVSGRVIFHALYTQGDPGKVSAMEATADFTHLLEAPGAQPRDVCRVSAQVEHTEASASGGRLNLRAVVGVSGRTITRQPVEALSGLQGGEGLQTSAKGISLRRTVAEGSSETLLREEFLLPAGLNVRETLYGTATAQLSETSGGFGRASMSGQVNLEAVHASSMPGKPVVITRHTLPFEHTVELTGEDGEQLAGRITVRDVAVASQDGEDGERVLRAEVLLGLEAWADRQENVTVLDDAYTVSGDDLRLTGQTVSCRTDDRQIRTAESGKCMLMLPEGAPPVRSVLAGFAVPVMTGREQIGGRLNAEGMLEITLLYMTDNDPAPVVVRQEEPFRVTFAAETSEDDFITLSASNVDVSAITSDRVEMKYILRMEASGVKAEEARLVTEATPVAAGDMESGIVLYFVQPGETLWDIARSYRVPLQEVKALNPEITGEPRDGQGVVIWRREGSTLA